MKLPSWKFPVEIKDVELFIESLDVDGNKELGFEEFCQWMAFKIDKLPPRQITALQNEELEVYRIAFKDIDKNQDGQITFGEFKNYLHDVLEEPLSDIHIKNLMRLADSDNNQLITEQEFVDAMRKGGTTITPLPPPTIVKYPKDHHPPKQ